MAPDGGFTFSTEDDVLFKWGRLSAGLRFFMGAALFRPDDFAPGAANPNPPVTRLGPVASFTLFEKDQPRLNPAVSVVLNWYLTHRWRTGAEVHQGIPYFLLVVSLWGDALPPTAGPSS